jgi:hypothetical protein
MFLLLFCIFDASPRTSTNPVMSLNLKHTLGFCIGKPTVYSADFLRDAIRDCNECLESSAGPETKAFMQEQKDKFQAELKRRRDLPPSRYY